MISIIHEPSGITLFSKIFDKFCELINDKTQSDLVGSFLSAIKKFSQSFGQDEIKQIEMSDIRFLIYEQDRIMIFLLIDVTDNIEEYKKILRICCNSFFQIYHFQIRKNFNDISVFQQFNPVLKEILKIPPEKIEPTCLNCPMGLRKDCLFKQVQEKMYKFKKNKKNIKIISK